MSGRLEGLVAVVTGGGHGIGRAYCHGLAREGALVAVSDLDGEAAARVAKELTDSGSTAMAHAGDVSVEADVQAMADSVVHAYGRVDCLVNNAARFLTVPLQKVSSIEEISVEEWDKVMAVNVRGVFLCCRAVSPIMKRQRYGKIVNIGSTTALQGLAAFAPYPVSKAAISGMTRGLARELGPYQVTVNTVAPGGTLSKDEPDKADLDRHESMLNLKEGQRVAGVTLRAIRRVQTSQDLVGAVVFLCSPESDFISGQTLVVDGGSYML